MSALSKRVHVLLPTDLSRWWAAGTLDQLPVEIFLPATKFQYRSTKVETAYSLRPHKYGMKHGEGLKERPLFLHGF
jgi:hypothetical protein